MLIAPDVNSVMNDLSPPCDDDHPLVVMLAREAAAWNMQDQRERKWIWLNNNFLVSPGRPAD